MVVKDCHVIDPCLIIFFLHFLPLHFSFSFSFSFRFTKFQKISLFHQTLQYMGHRRRISMIVATNGSFWGPHDHHQRCLPAWPSPLPMSPRFLVLSSPAVAKLLVAPSLAVLLSGITSIGGCQVLIFSLIYLLFYFFFSSLCLLLNMTETHVFFFLVLISLILGFLDACKVWWFFLGWIFWVWQNVQLAIPPCSILF